MKLITEGNFSGKTVLVRVDYNVPIKNGIISDPRRILASLPTIQFLINSGAKLVLCSHMGKPKGNIKPELSLKPVAEFLQAQINSKVIFVPETIGNQAKKICQNLQPGEIAVLENLRFHIQEEKGDTEFAKQLALLGNVYVNDAFGTAHRPHASVSVVADFFTEKYAGFLMNAEIENARKVMENPTSPYVAILGGAKVSDKILLIENLLKKVDFILIGGGMAYTFLSAMGKAIGNSLCEPDRIDVAKELLIKYDGKILIPIDSVATRNIQNPSDSTLTVLNNSFPEGYAGVDIGEKTIELFKEKILNAKTLLWNGPMGIFEIPEFASGTRQIAELVVRATHSGAYSLIGGGDSAAAIEKFGYADKVSYVSTGGGALLEFMEGKKLPGVEALN